MRNVENWIQGYLTYTRHMEAPSVFHLWAAIGAIGGALRGKVFIDQGYFKWTPNFFIIFVAPPGIVSKSTTMGVGLQFLRQVEGIKFGPDSVTWQALTDSFMDALEEFSVDGRKVLQSPITVAASELGTFLDPRNREMLDVLNDLWDGREIPWKRRTRADGEKEIKNPWFHFMGCTTPGWIEENWPEYAIKGGFASRTIFVYGEKKRSYIAYPGLEMVKDQQELDILKARLIQDLRTIATLSGKFQMTAGAVAWGTKWYQRHWEVDVKNFDENTYGGYLARKQTHIHKLAMVISASHRNDLIIDQEDLEKSEQLITSLEGTFHHIFTNMSDNRQAKNALAIIKFVQTTNGCDVQKLWQSLMKYMTHDEFSLGLKGAIASGYIKQIGTNNTIRLVPQSHTADVDSKTP